MALYSSSLSAQSPPRLIDLPFTLFLIKLSIHLYTIVYYKNTVQAQSKLNFTAQCCCILLFISLDGSEETLLLKCCFLFILQELDILITEKFLCVSLATKTT